MTTRTLLTTTLTGLALAVSLPAQRGSGSLDDASPEIATLGLSPAEITAMDDSCSPVPVWTNFDLGLLPTDEVDAFSDTNNTFPPFGPALGPPGSLVVVAFSVDRASAGLPGSVIAAEASTDGAASDVFEQRFAATAAGVTLSEDGRCLSKLPRQSNIDALNQTIRARYPVFFSVDPATASRLGYSPADILMITEEGAPITVALSEAALGLLPGDDIDALAIGKPGGLVYSLTGSSPTALANPLMGGAGLWSPIAVPIGPGVFGSAPWSFPADLELLPSDELNAVTIGDPRVQHHGSFDPQATWMCADPNTGATDATSVWRLFPAADRPYGWQPNAVEVGVNQVIGYDFPITVRVWGADTPDPQGQKILLGEDTLVYPQGTTPGTTFIHRFPDFFQSLEFWWIEMAIPPSPGFPNDGAFLWAGTANEFQPTFVHAPQCGIDMLDLDLLGQPDACLDMTVWTTADEPLTLLHGPLFPGQTVDFLTIGGDPNERIYFGTSMNGIGPGPCIPGLGNLCLDIVDPIHILGSTLTDPLGGATLPMLVPPALSGLELATQAVVRRGAGGLDSAKSPVIVNRIP